MVGAMCLLEGFPRVVKTENVEANWEDARLRKGGKVDEQDGDGLRAWISPPEGEHLRQLRQTLRHVRSASPILVSVSASASAGWAGHTRYGTVGSSACSACAPR